VLDQNGWTFGNSKLVAIGYGIKKLQITLIVGEHVNIYIFSFPAVDFFSRFNRGTMLNSELSSSNICTDHIYIDG
jgi:hypothetical protein